MVLQFICITEVQSADEKMVHFENWLIKALSNRNVNVESLHFLAKKQRFIGLSARQNFVLVRRTIMQSGKLHEFPCDILATWRQNFVKSVRFVALQYRGQKLARQVEILCMHVVVDPAGARGLAGLVQCVGVQICRVRAEYLQGEIDGAVQ